ncbi:MAG: hypothetical protein VYA34_03420 [Myxococcota bacterium]|nr:hypothetical protein [Myxococcota bacterium]
MDRTVFVLFIIGVIGSVAYFLFWPSPPTIYERDEALVEGMLKDGSFLKHILSGSYYGHHGFVAREMAIVRIEVRDGKFLKIEIIQDDNGNHDSKPQNWKMAEELVASVVAGQSLDVFLPHKNDESGYVHSIYGAIKDGLFFARYDNLEAPRLLKPRTLGRYGFIQDLEELRKLEEKWDRGDQTYD